tara:strand:+ start:875 stop:1096 length:222 start_codon:yes stop_codon:yes gene_type:complete
MRNAVKSGFINHTFIGDFDERQFDMSIRVSDLRSRLGLAIRKTLADDESFAFVFFCECSHIVVELLFISPQKS